MQRILTLVVSLMIASVAQAVGDVASTPHNLSTTGTGQFKSQTEDRICVFCHTPHSAVPDAPLWNRRSNGYTNYQSSTTNATAGTPGGSSTLCLSCHDGTIALGDMVGNTQGGNDLGSTYLTGRSNIGNNLFNDHPVGIVYDTGLQATDPDLVNPASVDLPLVQGELQCTSCHDPHSDIIPPFLRKTTQYGALCTTCHLPSGQNWDWASSSHALSTATPNGADPWPERKPGWKGQNVSENACMNCHTPHNAATPARLIKDLEEQTCFRCHGGSVAQKNILADIQKFYRHPVEQTPNIDHDAARNENPLTMPLHVECEDCHNSHASLAGPPMISFNPASPMDPNHTTAPLISGRLAGVSGIDSGGGVKAEADYEYEVCFKCHGVPGKNACDNNRCSTATRYNLVRQDGTYNLREKLDPGNPALVSYHPVVSNDPANNSEVPSLRTDIPLNRISSQIYCSDCHSSDVSPAAGGTGPAGPHGSLFEGLLTLRYNFDTQSAMSTSQDSLCLKCHDSGSLFNDDSFLHKKHVFEEGLSCINCHDPHGSAANPHLINFLTSSNVAGTTYEITGAGGFNEPTWQDDGQFSGTCYLSCHGKVHDGESY